MKYLLLIYTAPRAFEALSEEDRNAMMSEAGRHTEELKASGELVGGAALADIENSRTVRVRDGVPATTDGPFAEAKEQLAGYYVVDCDGIERATEIATADPAARFWAVEVRPIMDEVGMEM
jgi:hypothetical protein